MSKPAVTKGTYVDLRFLPGLKVARVSIDIPIEHSNEFLAMFGAPDRASPVWCAVARLAEPVAEPLPEGAQAPLPTPEKRHFKDMRRSQQAALKCQDRDFALWLVPETVPFGDDLELFDLADQTLKERLGITSKRVLDNGGPLAKAWDALLTDYDNRNHIR